MAVSAFHFRFDDVASNVELPPHEFDSFLDGNSDYDDSLGVDKSEDVIVSQYEDDTDFKSLDIVGDHCIPVGSEEVALDSDIIPEGVNISSKRIKLEDGTVYGIANLVETRPTLSSLYNRAHTANSRKQKHRWLREDENFSVIDGSVVLGKVVDNDVHAQLNAGLRASERSQGGHRRYDAKLIKAVVNAYKEGSKSLRAVARQYHMPESTLRRWIKVECTGSTVNHSRRRRKSRCTNDSPIDRYQSYSENPQNLMRPTKQQNSWFRRLSTKTSNMPSLEVANSILGEDDDDFEFSDFSLSDDGDDAGDLRHESCNDDNELPPVLCEIPKNNISSDYDAKFIKKVLDAYNSKTFSSQHECAEAFNVSDSLLRLWIRDALPPNSLDQDEEEKLLEFIRFMDDCQSSPSITQLITIVSQLVTQNGSYKSPGPDYEWIAAFYKKRQSSLRSVNILTENSRGKNKSCTFQIFDQHFFNLDLLFTTYKIRRANQIFCMAESLFADGLLHKSGCILSAGSEVMVPISSSISLSVVTTTSGNGMFLPPLFGSQSVSNFDGIIQTVADGVFANFNYIVDAFVAYFKGVLIPSINKVRINPNDHCIIFFRYIDSYILYLCSEIARKHKVLLYLCPPNSYDVLHPHDALIFESILKKFRFDYSSALGTQPQFIDFPRYFDIIKGVFHSTFSLKAIRDSFMVTGLWPLKANLVHIYSMKSDSKSSGAISRLSSNQSEQRSKTSYSSHYRSTNTDVMLFNVGEDEDDDNVIA